MGCRGHAQAASGENGNASGSVQLCELRLKKEKLDLPRWDPAGENVWQEEKSAVRAFLESAALLKRRGDACRPPGPFTRTRDQVRRQGAQASGEARLTSRPCNPKYASTEWERQSARPHSATKMHPAPATNAPKPARLTRDTGVRILGGPNGGPCGSSKRARRRPSAHRPAEPSRAGRIGHGVAHACARSPCPHVRSVPSKRRGRSVHSQPYRYIPSPRSDGGAPPPRSGADRGTPPAPGPAGAGAPMGTVERDPRAARTPTLAARRRAAAPFPPPRRGAG